MLNHVEQVLRALISVVLCVSTAICFGQPGLVPKELSAKPNFDKAEVKLSRVSKKKTLLLSASPTTLNHINAITL